MPQNSADWMFWAFSTLLVGFVLNVIAGLAANPISDALGRRRSRKTVPVLHFREPSFSSPPPSEKKDGSVSIHANSTADEPFPKSSQKHTLNDLSKEIDAFRSAVEGQNRGNYSPSAIRTRSTEARSTDSLSSLISLYNARDNWLATTLLFALVLIFTALAGIFGGTNEIPVFGLFVAAILLIMSVALLVKFMRRRVDYKTRSRY